jgi:hypothetical protein
VRPATLWARDGERERREKKNLKKKIICRIVKWQRAN